MVVKIKNAVAYGFFWLVDSKAGAVLATIAVIAFMGVGLPKIATALVDATSEGYTGTAVVQEHKINGSFCNVRVLMEDGTEDILIYGPRPMCGNVEDGMTLNMKKGNIHHD